MSNVSSGIGPAGQRDSERPDAYPGFGFSGQRRVHGPRAYTDRPQLNAARSRDSAQARGGIEFDHDNADSYSLSWLSQGLLADMIHATTDYILADRQDQLRPDDPDGQGITPDARPMPGEFVDVIG